MNVMIKNSLRAKCVAIVIAWAFLLSQALAVTGGPQLPDPGKAPLTRQQQIQLGFQAAAQVYQQMPVLPDDSPETQYIRQLGQKLVATIPSEYSWPFEFHVIPQKEINAFALPGGPMFVNVGTIAAAQDEAELAGVMAHEMAHVYMQHSAKQAGKTQTTAALAGLAGALIGALTGGAIGQLAQAGIQIGAQGVILKYSRSDEAQADAVGAIIMYKAGYNPQALADFFKTLEAEGGSGPQFLSDHPNPGNREQAIQQEIAQWPPKRFVTTSAAFDAAKKHVLNVQMYTAQQISQGAKSGQWASLNKQNGAIFQAPPGVAVSAPASQSQPSEAARPVSLQEVLPSGRLVTTDLGPLKIAAPDNWRVMAPSQRGDDIRIAPEAGVTGNAIGYGLLLNGVKPNRTANVDDVTNELVQEMVKGSGDDLRAVGSAQSITVAGVQGRSVNLESTSPYPDAKGQPQKERDWLVTVPRSDGSVLYFVFVAPQSEFNRFSPTYDSMLKSIQLQ
jgi:Zn-dependent protease with chaperone function